MQVDQAVKIDGGIGILHKQVSPLGGVIQGHNHFVNGRAIVGEPPPRPAAAVRRDSWWSANGSGNQRSAQLAIAFSPRQSGFGWAGYSGSVGSHRASTLYAAAGFRIYWRTGFFKERAQRTVPAASAFEEGLDESALFGGPACRSC